ncbi:MAG TPA: protease SohB [Myxococcales bacterium]|nr:protease SohB [Myxococcales bacterium]HAN32732.1 protease SohB [Myxococcales bacterium]
MDASQQLKMRFGFNRYALACMLFEACLFAVLEVHMVQIGWELLSFILKVGVVIGGLGVLVGLASRGKSRQAAGSLKIEHLNRKLTRLREQIARAGLSQKEAKRSHKTLKKAEQKADKSGAAERRRVFVLEFKGDMRAKAVESLRNEVSAIVQGAKQGDEVLVQIHSPGGAVSGYGLAASQLSRLTERGLHLTAAVDQVAASGGYLMAAVADRIIAAPFAMVGSIGVVAMVPNFRRFLARYDVDVEQLTAGEHKRTLSVFGHNTPEGREQFQQDLESIHQQFKKHVAQKRPQMNVDMVATGGHWTAANALELGLIDELQTSDEWLLKRCEDAELFAVQWTPERSLGQRFATRSQQALTAAVDQLRQLGNRSEWF